MACGKKNTFQLEDSLTGQTLGLLSNDHEFESFQGSQGH
jgi:hypothetical protein